MMRSLILVALLAVPVAAAQRSTVVVGVDDGGSVRPLARAEGRTWSPSCEAPARGAVRGTVDRPVLAVAGARAEGIQYVPRGGVVWRQLEPIVRRVFQVQERLQNVSLDVLVAIPADIESIASSVESATRPIYYFTASKLVPNQRPGTDINADGEVAPIGDLRIDVVGWVRAGAAGVPEKNLSLGTNTTLSWEQVNPQPLRGLSRRTQLTPVGIVRHGDSGVWVMQGRLGESRWFSLYDVGVGGVRMVARSDPQEC